MQNVVDRIQVVEANEHNLKNVSLSFPRNKISVVTGVSGSGKSSLVFDTVLAEAQRRFFFTLSHYSRQFLDFGSRPMVKSVSGLSPAISLQQYETNFSKVASVGSLTDLTELFGVLFSRFGEKYCPNHGHSTTPLTLEQICHKVFEEFENQKIAVFIPIAESKKGQFKAKFSSFAKKGYVKAFVDGELNSLTPPPELNKDEKHTIKILVDLLNITEKTQARMKRAIETSLQEAEGHVQVIPLGKSKDEYKLPMLREYSLNEGCSQCNFSWGSIDARHFSSNSLGKCKECSGYGVTEEDEESDEENFAKCPKCRGTGIDEKFGYIKIRHRSIQDLYTYSVEELEKFFENLSHTELMINPATQRLIKEISSKISGLIDVDLGYLQIYRKVRSLSGGEAQRLRLAGVLGESLRGILYVLDEPSQGLHSSELEMIWKAIESLKKQGNTVIIVDHDEYIIKNSDFVVDLGPGGGAEGGRIVATFDPQNVEAFSKVSKTAAYLAAPKKMKVFEDKKNIDERQFIKVINARLHNLKIEKALFMLGTLNVVTGVSGTGKSSLIVHTLFRNIHKYLKNPVKNKFLFEFCDDIEGIEKILKINLIDRKPIAKSSVSMPITYLDLFGDIRKLYELTSDSQIAGFTAKTYSMNGEGGRCEECKGRGEIVLSMKFLSDARIKCTVCEGRRYKEEICEIKYNGLSISEVLNLTLQEAFEHFKSHKKIVKKLRPAIELGLGYLKMGQTSNSLSGGEAQRLKLVPFLGKTWEEGNILIIDEPTLGLHFVDVERLLKVLKSITEQGATIILIEHNVDVILSADWVVDIGPNSAKCGGELMYQGAVSGMKEVDSPTGRVMQELF